MVKKTWSGTVARVISAVAVASVAMVIVACGAVIDTTLTINEDGSGQRLILATIEPDDLEEVDGGAKAIDALIKENKPDALDYDGYETSGDDNVTFQFAVNFSDPDDYRAKVLEILGAGDIISEDRKAEIVVENSLFINGVSVEENFTSQDLLAWLTNALVKTGKLSSSNEGSASELGLTAVKIDGDRVETNGQISHSTMVDHGVRAMDVTTTLTPGGVYAREISYTLPREVYSQDPEAFDQFFADATPAQGELTAPSEAESTWTIAFEASSAEDLVAGTNQALASESTDFAVSTSSSPTSPLNVVTTVVDAIDCSTICSPEATISHYIQTPTDWYSESSYSESSTEEGALWPVSDEAESLSFEHQVALHGVGTDIALEEDGGGEATLTYSISPEDHAVVGDGVVAALQPAEGTIEVVEGEDHVDYVVTFSSEDDFETVLEENLPGSDLRVSTNDEGGIFSTNRIYTLQLALPEQLLTGVAGEELSYALTFDGGTVDAEHSRIAEGGTIEGSAVSFTGGDSLTTDVRIIVAYPNTGGMITAGAVAGGAVLLLVALVVWILIARRRSTRKRNEAPATMDPGPPPPPPVTA